MSLDERSSALIKRIYCARDNPHEWEGIVDEVLTLTGAHAALATVVDLSDRVYSASRFYGPDDSQFARGFEEYGDIYDTDPSLRWASQNPQARFCDSSRTLPEEDYLSNPYVRWNQARFGSTHWYVGFTPPDDHLSYSFSLHFPAEQGPGSKQALRLFRMLFDHMECAHRLACRPFNAESDRPLVLLDSGGIVRGVSNGATSALRAPDGLAIQEQRLRAALPAEQNALDSAIARAASVVSSGTASIALKISRPSGQRPWLVTIRPLISGYGAFGLIKCELLVQLHDGLPHIGSLHLVKSLFDLTGRELQVLRLLMDGHSVESLARYMVISTNTARAHLRSIFAKTCTSRQSELLQLCAGLANA